MLEVDVTEEAKQVALYRYELTGELYDDDEILNFFYNANRSSPLRFILARCPRRSRTLS